MITTETWLRRALFRNDTWARLLIDTLYHYRGSAYLLHEFVIMPDHIHVLITPTTSLEKSVQFIKGGFSYRAKRELGSNMEIWQGLKPIALGAAVGAPEGAPFQSAVNAQTY
jgi:putative transposase